MIPGELLPTQPSTLPASNWKSDPSPHRLNTGATAMSWRGVSGISTSTISPKEAARLLTDTVLLVHCLLVLLPLQCHLETLHQFHHQDLFKLLMEPPVLLRQA